MDKIFNQYFTKRFIIIFLIFLGIVLYLNTFFNEFFWDDEDIIYNYYLKDWRHLPKYFTENLVAGAGKISDYWRPLLLISFSLDWKIARANPLFYHFHNTFLHIAAAILLFLILEKLTNRKRWFPFLVSLVFLIHPLQTEAVTYVSGRGDSLSAFFIFLSILFFIKAFNNQLIKKWYFLSLVCFILSLLSKETAMATPFLLFLIMLSFQEKFFHSQILNLSKREKIRETLFQSIKKLIPFFIILAIFISLRLTILNFRNILDFYPEPNFYSENFNFRLFTFFKTLLIYLGLIFFPHNLHMERVVAVEISPSFPVILGFLVFSGMIILAIFDFFKFFSPFRARAAGEKDLSQAERPRFERAEGERESEAEIGAAVASVGQPTACFRTSCPSLFFFGIFWFFITLFPFSNIIVPLPALLYEHWMYLPLIGIFICLFHFFGKLKPDWIGLKNLLFILLIFYFAFFSVSTVLRNGEWRDPIVFYNQVLKHSRSYRVYNNLGMAYSDIGEREKAKENYLKAIELEPDKYEAYNNLGQTFFRQGEHDKALFYYQKALAIKENNPTTILNLGEFYFKKGNWELAKTYYLRYIETTPLDFYPHLRLGEISFFEGNCEESFNHLNRAKELAPKENRKIQQGLSLLIEEAKRCK